MNELNPNYGSICNNKNACLQDLKASYARPGHPIAFSGIQQIYRYYRPHLTVEDIEKTLSEIESYTLHKEFHSQQRNPSYSHFKRYQFQCDLIDVRGLAKYNDGINYLLTCIDTFTRYAFVRPLTTKHGPKVLQAFKSILQEAVEYPKNLVFDRGAEFYNQDFLQFCRRNSIQVYSPDTSIHGAFIERFNRTLQSIIYKYMTENETNRYIDVTDHLGQTTQLLSKFVRTYNNRIHRMIGTTPYTAETNHNSHLEIRKRMSKYYEQIKPRAAKFKVGDYVRVVKLRGKFDRGYNERAAKEIFKIHAINEKLKIPLYVLSNYSGTEIIKGSFYENEITRASGDIFRVEKVIKKRKYRGRDQLYVKWKGFDESHNSWIDSSEVVRKF